MNTITKSYKFRLYPNQYQKQMIEKTFGCKRFVFNHFLAKSIQDYESTKSRIPIIRIQKGLLS